MIEIFNVLVKGVEIVTTPFCQAFSKEESAREWVNKVCEYNSWTIKSSLGWNDDNTFDDYRVEDKDGNSFYFVIYRQWI
jgi:hypothetical protein